MVRPSEPVAGALGQGVRRVGLIAGGGALPVEIARRLADAGHAPFVLVIKDEGFPERPMQGVECDSVMLEEMGSITGRLKSAGVSHVVFAGSVARRPRLSRIRWSLGLLSMLPRLVPALRRGDDAALRAAIAHLEDSGLTVVGAHEIVPDLLASEGVLTRAAPLATDWRDIRAAREAARAIGALDIGQAAIAIGGRAVALEGIEGTDGLLERMIALRTHGRLAAAPRGVIAKCMKPKQESRADLPAIGPATVTAAHRAGLAGIVVEAGRSLVLERERAVEEADSLGMFIVGLPPEDTP